jgi:hypothetical protein
MKHIEFIRKCQNHWTLLEGLDPSVPVILWCLDNSAFKALNQNGDLTSVTRLPKDKKFHVIAL